jgi:glycosyltransferase involved in cell wall biosynthesis
MPASVSIIIPCFNEERFIADFLASVLEQDWPKEFTEIILVDGNSTDRTCEIINRIAEKNSNIRLLKNDKRFVPSAMNIGIKASHGEIIVRMDAHTFYPADYVSLLVKYLLELNADNVGAVFNHTPGDNTMKALAISKILSSPFGVGDARFRLGAKEICQVDTVPYGCYRREVFDKIGYFDEELMRNQDDEFNARLIKNGGKIYLIPFIRITYHTRTEVKKLMTTYYQYGLFKPLVFYKMGRPTSVRQLIPMFFLLFIILTLTGSFFFIQSFWTLIAGLGLYLVADIFFSIRIANRSKESSLLLFLPWLFFELHISYGFGYIMGIIRFILFKRKKMKITTSR